MAAKPVFFELSENYVATLDPLGLDEALRELPKHNEAANVPWLSNITQKVVETAAGLDNPDTATATACLRDLDFLAGSLLRHGTDPIQTISGLGDTMLRMGSVADTVPRGTVATYAVANPQGDRKRSFTGSPEEELFTEGLRSTYEKLETATHALSEVALTSPTANHELTPALQAASEGMDTMIRSVVDVKRNITPHHFSKVMRPYFESLTIAGQEYHAPNGGQLQLLPLEAMLCNGNGEDPTWRAFLEANQPYLTPAQRTALTSFKERNGDQTVLSHVKEAAERGNADGDVIVALGKVLKGVRKFRYPHVKVTEDNFKLRPDGAVGSGSFTLDTLRQLVTNTENNIQTLHESTTDNK